LPACAELDGSTAAAAVAVGGCVSSGSALKIALANRANSAGEGRLGASISLPGKPAGQLAISGGVVEG